MDQKFRQIDQEYSGFYKELMRKGRFPMKETSLGYWGYSIGHEVFELFQKVGLSRCKSFIDLGSGDGKVVNIAALFTNATGIEPDRELIDKSLQVKHKFGLDKARFLQGNFMSHDLSQYDLLYIYPDKRMHELEDKLLKEMKGRLIVIGLHFLPLRLKKESEFFVGLNKVTIYTN